MYKKIPTPSSSIPHANYARSLPLNYIYQAINTDWIEFFRNAQIDIKALCKG